MNVGRRQGAEGTPPEPRLRERRWCSVSAACLPSLFALSACAPTKPIVHAETTRLERSELKALLNDQAPLPMTTHTHAGPVAATIEPGERAAVATVRRFLDAIAAESLPRMGSLVTNDATFHLADGRAGSLIGRWSQRFSRYDLSPLREALRFGPTHLRTVLTQNQQHMPNHHHRALKPVTGDVIVQVALTLPTKIHQVIGSRFEFWLTPDSGDYKVTSVVEHN